MKQFFTLLLLSHSILTAQTWVKLPSAPLTRRDDGVAVTVNNKIYCGTGLQVGFTVTKDFAVFDPLTLTWSAIPDMPPGAQRQYACAFAGNNCFYVFGGDYSGALNSLYKFDVLNNTWTQMAAKPGNGLIAASCLNFGSKVIIIGGKIAGNGPVSDEVWEYNLTTNAWTQLNNFTFGGRWRGSAAVLNGKGYFLFGIDVNGVFRREFFEYNPGNDAWTKLHDVPVAKGRAYSAFQALSNKLVLFSGCDSDNTYYNDVWLYHPLTQTWAQDAALPSFARKGGMSTVAYDNFYYSCGIDKTDERTNETWMIDIPLGISENKITNNLNVFPNPCSEKINVVFNEGAEKPELLTFHDAYGKEIAQYKISGENVTEIDATPFPNGIYFLKVYSKENMLIAVSKVTKQ